MILTAFKRLRSVGPPSADGQRLNCCSGREKVCYCAPNTVERYLTKISHMGRGILVFCQEIDLHTERAFSQVQVDSVAIRSHRSRSGMPEKSHLEGDRRVHKSVFLQKG